MKTVVIFYSLEGNTKFIAKVLAKELKADLIELETVKSFPSSGLKKFVWGGKSVMLKEQPQLSNENIDLTGYDNVLIGTPVWAGTCSSPMNTFVRQYPFTGKKVGFFVCAGGGSTTKCFNVLKEALPENQFIGEIDFVDPLRKNKNEDKIKALKWAKQLQVE